MPASPAVSASAAVLGAAPNLGLPGGMAAAARHLAAPVGAAGAGLPGPVPRLTLPVTPLPTPGWVQTLLELPAIKVWLPIPILVALAFGILWVFRRTWQELDAEALERRQHLAALRRTDYRPAACLVITAVVLTMQEYYGGRSFYDAALRDELRAAYAHGHAWLRLERFDELYGYAWWSLARVLGYVVLPFTAWKLLFPGDRLLDMGLRGRGFLTHLWIYGACLAVVVPVMLLVAQQPDFGTYYPFYKASSRSWVDFAAWEALYWVQFFSLELFFRGWMVSALRGSLGSAAIFAMTVPYCMIHYGKPYLEAHGAIVAGVVLGSLAVKTRSIYAGFLVHITVAVGMDLLSLYKRAELPHVLWPG